MLWERPGQITHLPPLNSFLQSFYKSREDNLFRGRYLYDCGVVDFFKLPQIYSIKNRSQLLPACSMASSKVSSSLTYCPSGSATAGYHPVIWSKRT